jgi:hypothetical protein
MTGTSAAKGSARISAGMVPTIARALLFLVLLVAGAAALAAPAPAPARAPVPSDKTCDAVTSGDFARLYKGKAHLTQILSHPRYLPRGSTGSLLVRKPATIPGGIPNFRVLLAGHEDAVQVEEVRDGLPPELAEQLELGGGTQWYQLMLTVRPAERLLQRPVDWRRVYVFGCANDGTILAAGEKALPTSAALPARLTALAIVLLIYMALVTFVWSRRRSLTEAPTNVQAPLRWQRVEAHSWWRCADPVVLTADIFDRGSLTKLQILLFSLLVIYQIVEVLLRTGVLSELSPSVIALLGIPAVGSILSQAANLSTDRLTASNWAWLTSRGILPLNDRGARVPRWSDLFMSDAELDLYKVQAAAFSLVVAIGFLLSGMDGFTDFSVPDSLLQILGLSQVVLVGGRFTKPATLKELDTLISELKLRSQVLRRAALTGIDVDPEGKPVDPVPAAAAGAPFKTFAAASAAAAVPNASSRYRDLAAEVEVLLEGLTHRDVDMNKLKDPTL